MEQSAKLQIPRSWWKRAHFSGNMDSTFKKTYDTNLRSAWIPHMVTWPWKNHLTLKAHGMVLWREVVSKSCKVQHDLHRVETQPCTIVIRGHNYTTYMRTEFLLFGDPSFLVQTICIFLKVTHDIVPCTYIVFTSGHAWASWPTNLINKVFLISKHINISKWVI